MISLPTCSGRISKANLALILVFLAFCMHDRPRNRTVFVSPLAIEFPQSLLKTFASDSAVFSVVLQIPHFAPYWEISQMIRQSSSSSAYCAAEMLRLRSSHLARFISFSFHVRFALVFMAFLLDCPHNISPIFVRVKNFLENFQNFSLDSPVFFVMIANCRNKRKRNGRKKPYLRNDRSRQNVSASRCRI